MVILGYVSALCIGLSLGLIGSGGTILALPIFVYLFKIKEMQIATHYSMFVVGITAFIGAYKKHREALVDVRTAIYFLIPSLISLYFTRKIILPIIPEIIIDTNGFVLSKNMMLLLLFAIVMLFSSVSMIKNANQQEVDCFAKTPQASANPQKTTIAAIVVGILTALLGAGGGFLIIPTLVLLKEHCMKRAIGTSLIIITINSFIGFMSDIKMEANWSMLLKFTGIAIIGMLLSIRWTNKMQGTTLKKLFGAIVLVMGICIILKELFL